MSMESGPEKPAWTQEKVLNEIRSAQSEIMQTGAGTSELNILKDIETDYLNGTTTAEETVAKVRRFRISDPTNDQRNDYH